MSTETIENNEIIEHQTSESDEIMRLVKSSMEHAEGGNGKGVSPETTTEEKAEQTTDAKPNDVTEKATQNKGESTEQSTDEVKTDSQPTFDAIKYLEVSSVGKLKTEEDFKSALQQLDEIDTLRSEVNKLKEERETIFANEYVRKLNQMVKDGKTKEQIEEFTRLSEMGDISKLDPKEILVQELIDNGTKRSIAEIMVDKKYGLSDFGDLEDLTDNEKRDLEVIKEQMRIDSISASKKLSEKLDGINNPIASETKAIEEQAAKESYKEKLKVFANDLSSVFPKKFFYEANGQKLSYDVPQEEIDSIKEEAIEYFFDKKTNVESVKEFVEAKKWAMFSLHGEKILSDVAAQHDAIGYKRAKDEFENRTGLTLENAAPINDTDDLASFAMSVANKERY